MDIYLLIILQKVVAVEVDVPGGEDTTTRDVDAVGGGEKTSPLLSGMGGWWAVPTT